MTRKALFEVLFGAFEPQGRLPVQMPGDMETVERHAEDAPFDLVPYTDEMGNAWDHGFGLNWKGKIE